MSNESFFVVVHYNRTKQDGKWITDYDISAGPEDRDLTADLIEHRKAFKPDRVEMYFVTRPAPGATIVTGVQPELRGDFQDQYGLVWKIPTIAPPTPAPVPEPINFTPAPTYTTLPVVTHTPTPQLYELRIQCPVNPQIPGYLVDKMRSALQVGGYDLANVARVPEGYTIQISKNGSITLTAAAVIVIGILALLAVGVIAYTWIRLSDNSTVETNSNNATSTIAQLQNMRASGQIDEQTFNELVQAVLASYKPGETPQGSGGFFDSIDSSTLILGAAVLLLATRR